MSHKLETDIRAESLSKAAIEAGLQRPIRFRAESEREATELVWPHSDGRVSVYANPGGGFAIEDAPTGKIDADNIETIDEVVEILTSKNSLWDPDKSELRAKSQDKDSSEIEDGFPTV